MTLDDINMNDIVYGGVPPEHLPELLQEALHELADNYSKVSMQYRIAQVAALTAAIVLNNQNKELS